MEQGGDQEEASDPGSHVDDAQPQACCTVHAVDMQERPLDSLVGCAGELLLIMTSGPVTVVGVPVTLAGVTCLDPMNLGSSGLCCCLHQCAGCAGAMVGQINQM